MRRRRGRYGRYRYTHIHGHDHGRHHEHGHSGGQRSWRENKLEILEEHRRDVEEYLADLSDCIRRLQERKREDSSVTASSPPPYSPPSPEASPEPS